MVRITIDQELREKLARLDGPAELFDEQGQAVGRFVPIRDPLLAEVEAQCPHTPEELDALQARARREGGRPLADIWKDLGRK